jgi:hypothetical protein
MVLAGSATAAVVAATGMAGKSQLAAQSIGALAAGTPGVASTATQGVGIAQSGGEILSGNGIGDATNILADASKQLSSVSENDFELGDLDDIISDNSELADHNKPAIKGLGPN